MSISIHFPNPLLKPIFKIHPRYNTLIQKFHFNHVQVCPNSNLSKLTFQITLHFHQPQIHVTTIQHSNSIIIINYYMLHLKTTNLQPSFKYPQQYPVKIPTHIQEMHGNTIPAAKDVGVAKLQYTITRYKTHTKFQTNLCITIIKPVQSIGSAILNHTPS